MSPDIWLQQQQDGEKTLQAQSRVYRNRITVCRHIKLSDRTREVSGFLLVSYIAIRLDYLHIIQTQYTKMR